MSRRSEDALGLLASWDGQAQGTTRIGVLLPWANQAVETELPRLGLAHTVFHYARLVPASRATAVDASFWHGLREAATDAVESLAHLPLDGTVLACTSAGFTGGPALPDGVMTAFDALTGVLHALDISRVALGTPYPTEVTAAEAAALTSHGLEVVAHASLGLADGYPGVAGEDVRTLIRQIPADALRTADAVVLSCTGWHTLSVLRDIQQAVGRPVISSNLAMALFAARLAIGAPL
ncbi:hypothetical protein ACFV80_40230 [Streptomyces sp. NPDC059862]|uniref:maleate cis-trans isomerase family protein n=1 Tax=Streptomyces sp. NPDC059862 TaxID=3346975 RepID=UPI00365FA327